jgi:quercetin dioxygenase-like cupin family protein
MNPRPSLVDTILLITLSLGTALLLGIAALLLPAAVAHAHEPHHTLIEPGDLKWAQPPTLPPGAQAAVLFGSPAKEGPFVLRLKFPAGFTVPPHKHSQAEMVTVISGEFGIASAEKFDPASIRKMPPGSFVHLPPGMPHFARVEVETVLQINGMGPFDVVYIDPNDDPRKK